MLDPLTINNNNNKFIGYVPMLKYFIRNENFLNFIDTWLAVNITTGDPNSYRLSVTLRDDLKIEIDNISHKDKETINKILIKNYLPIDIISKNRLEFNLHHILFESDLKFWEAFNWIRENNTAPWSKWYKSRIYMSPTDAMIFKLQNLE